MTDYLTETENFEVWWATATPLACSAWEAWQARAELDSSDEAKQVCAEAYQIVGSMLSDLDQFDTDRARKVLDNLNSYKLVHNDVLPWPSFAQPAQPATCEIWHWPDLADDLFVDEVWQASEYDGRVQYLLDLADKSAMLKRVQPANDRPQKERETESEKHSFVRSTMKHHGIDHHVYTALIADLIYGLEAMSQPADDRLQKEQAQRDVMTARFVEKSATAATADFDLPAPNDIIAQPEQPASWQPIETAPKDGTTILLFNETAPTWQQFLTGRWTHDFWRGQATPSGKYILWMDATHWQPLIPPPATKETK